ncbi:hypothetical protein [Aquibacillus saliphilus]|nr:hypothetical protein [Aquibacillus saliphilus]
MDIENKVFYYHSLINRYSNKNDYHSRITVKWAKDKLSKVYK